MGPFIDYKVFTIIDNGDNININIGFFYESYMNNKVVVRPLSDYLTIGNGSYLFDDIKSTLYESFDDAYKAVDNALYFLYPWKWKLIFID
jgi:hypothetical protein